MVVAVNLREDEMAVTDTKIIVMIYNEVSEEFDYKHYGMISFEKACKHFDIDMIISQDYEVFVSEETAKILLEGDETHEKYSRLIAWPVIYEGDNQP